MWDNEIRLILGCISLCKDLRLMVVVTKRIGREADVVNRTEAEVYVRETQLDHLEYLRTKDLAQKLPVSKH